ncbi:hypothetical protein GIW06_06230 [Pseudomonas syringae]|nr:hypothetical protein [Pseudomonas syringae]PYD10168.1 hypothetical protein DND47_28210 [Pseudomonas syringae pv. syringae]MCF5200843.1 hypothetical protein [Pseudomonas syringae]MCF5203938.1 hypothetical protein [Pseudomonas syringae]MCF5208893.1 hypothetical protein [Pseudomonas syringae]
MRHESALRRVLRNGRGAPRTAFPRWSVGTMICAMTRGLRSGRYRSIPQFLPQTGILGTDSRSGSL